MTDATILIPTYRHVPLLPHAVRSALDQAEVTVEVFVVGDGVEDGTRAVLEPFTDDPRFRFFDFPKSPRHGEPYRHEVLNESTGRIVCYLSDDDLLLPGHATGMSRLLDSADFAHGPSVFIDAAGAMLYLPTDLGDPAFVHLARAVGWSIGLTGAAHTLEAYRRLPHGWRTAPAEIFSDHYMWLQWFDLPDLRAVCGRKLTYLHFPSPRWESLPEAARADALEEWFRRSREPGFPVELDELLLQAIRRTAANEFLYARMLQGELELAQKAEPPPPAPAPPPVRRARLRALFARRPGAR